MCIHQEHYSQLLALYPGLPDMVAKDVIPIPSKPMSAAITVKHRGESFLRLEIAFLFQAGDTLRPDHKMTVRVDLYERKAVPESIWFLGKGTQHTREPKVGVNPQIVNVIARRLGEWLNTLTASSATAH
jgi:hypothetical protein